MGSNGSTSTPGARMMPFLAILRHDLRGLGASWLLRLWLAASAVLTLILTLSQWADKGLPTAELIARLLIPYLVFPWFLVVFILGVAPVSAARAESLADGILSRPVTRYEYLLASWLSRVVVVLGVYLVVMVPTILLIVRADRPESDHTVTWYGILAALGAVALVMVFQVSLAFFLGTLLRKPLLATMVLIFVWFPIIMVPDVFSLEEFSPITLDRALPTLLRQPWRPLEEDAQRATADEDLAALSRQAAHFLQVFSGAPQEPAPQEPGFYNRDQFDDFSLTRVLLGYGLPALAAVALATLCFCLRDL